MQAKYLKINGVEFADGVTVEDIQRNLLPSAVVPAVKTLKNVERAINGKVHIDIYAVIKEITVTFGNMSNEDFEFLYNLIGTENLEPEPCNVEYFEFSNSPAKRAVCFVDSFEYTPYALEDKLTWRDITVKFCEISGKTTEETQ